MFAPVPPCSHDIDAIPPCSSDLPFSLPSLLCQMRDLKHLATVPDPHSRPKRGTGKLDVASAAVGGRDRWVAKAVAALKKINGLSDSSMVDVVEQAVLQVPKETLLKQFAFSAPWPKHFRLHQTISADNGKEYEMNWQMDELWARFLPSRWSRHVRVLLRR